VDFLKISIFVRHGCGQMCSGQKVAKTEELKPYQMA